MSDYDNKGMNYDRGSPYPQVAHVQQPQGYGPAPDFGPPQAGYSQQPQPYYPSPGVQYSKNDTTTVIVTQPTAVQGRGAPRMWSTGLMDCGDDMGICCMALMCPLCLKCQVSSDMGESACVPWSVPMHELVLRVKWRTQENIEGSILDDCSTMWCCGLCALCQLAREVKKKKNGTLYA